MSLQTRLSALITAMKGDFVGLHDRISTLEGITLPTPPQVAAFRCVTAFNVNSSTAGVYIPWDATDANNRRLDAGITISGDHTSITVAGTPSYVHFAVNIVMEIDNALSIQRPNQVVTIERSDGREFAGSSTGYIRDASDHENSSHNFTVNDAFPIADATYRIKSRRESGSGSPVTIMTDHTQFDVEVYR